MLNLAFPILFYVSLCDTAIQQKKDIDRRKSNGRRFCLGKRIYPIPCRASFFTQDDFEEQDELILFFQIILVQFILLFKIILGKTASAARNLVNSSPQREATTFTFHSVLSFFYGCRPQIHKVAKTTISSIMLVLKMCI